jgi:hypothetical protein
MRGKERLKENGGQAGHAAGMLGLGITAILSITPLLVSKRPGDPISTDERLFAFESRTFILAAMWLVIVYRAWLDRRFGERHALLVNLLLGGLAITMAGWHWHAIDNASEVEANGSLTRIEGGQRQLYQHVLNREAKSGNHSLVPHVYRPLPYGFARFLELLTGDWYFACWSYRWFFTYWFLWASWTFCRYYHSASVAAGVVGWMALLYPLSLWHYRGQLTDPMSHALFVLALYYIVTNQWWPLFLSLVIGVAAKETAIVLVLAYGACHWRGGLLTLAKSLGLLLGCIGAYLAVRLPAGWLRSLTEEASVFQSINATEGLMIWRNLHIRMDWVDYRPRGIENYLLPALFVGPFVPGIIRNWARTDRCVRTLAVSVAPLVLASSLCFSWMYEARNYMPLIPLLASAAIAPGTTMQKCLSRLAERRRQRTSLMSTQCEQRALNDHAGIGHTNPKR